MAIGQPLRRQSASDPKGLWSAVLRDGTRHLLAQPARRSGRLGSLGAGAKGTTWRGRGRVAAVERTR